MKLSGITGEVLVQKCKFTENYEIPYVAPYIIPIFTVNVGKCFYVIESTFKREIGAG